MARASERRPVYFAGEEDGVLSMTMRFIDGTDLRQLIDAQGGVPPTRAAHIVAHVGAALDAGHGVGLVDRDVKPGNVLLNRADHAYLTDFGYAPPSSLPRCYTERWPLIRTSGSPMLRRCAQRC